MEKEDWTVARGFGNSDSETSLIRKLGFGRAMTGCQGPFVWAPRLCKHGILLTSKAIKLLSKRLGVKEQLRLERSQSLSSLSF